MTDTTTDQSPAPLGHNRPPAIDAKAHETLDKKTDNAVKQCEKWIASGDLSTEEKAEELRDFLAKLGALDKAIEKQRTAEKAPLLEAGRQIDGAYNKLRERLSRMTARVKPILQKWLQKIEDERRARAAELERLAAEKRAQAAEAERLAAESGRLLAEEKAAEAAKEAEKAEKLAAKIAKEKVKVASASGGARSISVRTRIVADLVDINQAFIHYRDRPELADCLTGLANAECRAKDKPEAIPGFRLREVQTL